MPTNFFENREVSQKNHSLQLYSDPPTDDLFVCSSINLNALSLVKSPAKFRLN